jgi:hypothetical protein
LAKTSQIEVLGAARGLGVEQALHTLNRASAEIAMRLAKPGERLHGRGYQNRVDAIRQLLIRAI